MRSNDIIMLQELMIYQCDIFILDNLNYKFTHIVWYTKWHNNRKTIKMSCHFSALKYICYDVQIFGIDERIWCVKLSNNKLSILLFTFKCHMISETYNLLMRLVSYLWVYSVKITVIMTMRCCSHQLFFMLIFP